MVLTLRFMGFLCESYLKFSNYELLVVNLGLLKGLKVK